MITNERLKISGSWDFCVIDDPENCLCPDHNKNKKYKRSKTDSFEEIGLE